MQPYEFIKYNNKDIKIKNTQINNLINNKNFVKSYIKNISFINKA